jgi:transcriptional regulator
MANNIDATEKQAKALVLRKAGASYAAIAEALGYGGVSGAFKAVSSALKKTLREPADELRTLELARLDDMLKAIAGHVAAGNLTAIDRALKIQQRRAALLGLDMPTKIENSGDVRVTIEYAKINNTNT